MPRDPSVPFKDHIRTIRFGTPAPPKSIVDDNGNKRTEHIRDTDGYMNGWSTEHADGRQDAQIFVDAPALNPELPTLKAPVDIRMPAPRPTSTIPASDI